MKVLGCRIEEKYYNVINDMKKTNSDVLRSIIIDYVKSLQKPTNKQRKHHVNKNKQGYDYNTVSKEVDKLIDCYFKPSEEG